MSVIQFEAVAPVVGNNVAAELETIADRLRTSYRTHIEAALKVGEDLVRARELLPHGEFLPWVERELRWTARTAQNYMGLFSNLGESENISYLPLATAYELAAAPEPTRVAVLSRISAGEQVPAPEIKAIVREAKAADRHFRRPARGARGARKMSPVALAKRQTREQREEEERQARWAAQKAAYTSALAIITECLGNRLEEVVTLLREAGRDPLADDLVSNAG